MDQLEGNKLEGGIDWVKASHMYEKIITSENETLQIRATVELGRRSKDAPETILAQIVPILVELLCNSCPSIQEAAAYCLDQFTRRGDATLCALIGQSSVVPSILRLLPQSEGVFRKLLIKCLRSMVTCDGRICVILARNGGLEIIISLITSSVDGIRRYLLEILSSMVMLREVRRVIIILGGLPLLIESAQYGKMMSRTRAAQAIGLLGVTKKVRKMLVELGVIPVLIELMRDGDREAKLKAGNALGIISSHVDYLRPVARAGAIPLFAGLLEGPEPIGKEIAEDVFCILAVVEENAVLIAEHIVRILHGDNDGAKAAAADVLWDLSGYKHSISVVRESGAIPLLLELLRSEHDDIREKASGAVAQLSYDVADRRALADVGAIPILIDLLQDELEELKDNVAEALINFSQDPMLRDSVSEAFNIPSFRDMQDRLARIRASDERAVRSMRRLAVGQFTGEPGFS
ncbi:ARM repeat superfamily protein [Tasmannia lanceolata]|uniref:ARM repeat superfamily protein n=1 Tax=Tasmannia lanceolata TaxID=3420 RepID=UPI0040636ECA